MATFVFSMNQSLDGYVDDMGFMPGPGLFRHFIDHVAGLSGSLYGRRMYEIMRYWDDERPEFDETEREFAAAWRKSPKWVVSRTLDSVGLNATLVGTDLKAVVARLTAEHEGEIDVAGPGLAGSLTELGLIDDYRIYLHHVVLGSGSPFFTEPRTPLRLRSSEEMGEDVVRLVYVPA